MIGQLRESGWVDNVTQASSTPHKSWSSSHLDQEVPSRCRNLQQLPVSSAASEPPTKRQRLDSRDYNKRTVQNDTAFTLNSTAGVLSTAPTSPNLSCDDASHAKRQLPVSDPCSTPKTVRKESVVLYPFPLRPSVVSVNGDRSRREATKQSTKIPVSIKQHIAEAPAKAPRLGHQGPADFHPWTGNHSEDTINESTSRNGFYDRLQSTQSESTTARPSVWSSLKHKSGLQVLSSLFGSTLTQRQLHSTIIGPSTFKPPPRVTLTDAKREAWLKDLADPTIPLRRLSRTIPHGIRGKTLLDHCLHKGIPIARAIWLAKCIGANEIRAFQRKGTAGAFAVGGELKWVKDWTASVEQFLESIIRSCGSAGWRGHAAYSLRLIAGLHDQRLLDEEHYRDWLTQGFRSANLDILPFWLLIIQMHRAGLYERRSYGQQITTALLEHFHGCAIDAERGGFRGLRDSIMHILREIALDAPASFISASEQSKLHLKNLLSHVQRDDAVFHTALNEIIERNNILEKPFVLPSDVMPAIDRRHLVEELDRINRPSNMKQLLQGPLNEMHQHRETIFLILEWGSSMYRQSQALIYKTVHLLRLCSQMDVDLMTHVLDFLGAAYSIPSLDSRRLYRILAELFRSKHLSVGKYLHWMIARGIRPQVDVSDSLDPCEARLLMEIPSSGLPKHLDSLRRALIDRAGGSAKEEAVIATNLKLTILTEFSGRESHLQNAVTYLIGPRLPQSVRSFVACWLRDAVSPITTTTEAVQLSDLMRERKNFQKAISILVRLEDFSVLADFLRLSMLHSRKNLREAVACVNFHLEIFTAIGATPWLFEQFFHTFQMNLSKDDVDADLLDSLCDLGTQIPSVQAKLDVLHQTKRAFVQKSAVMVCSPISDHVAEALQSVEESFADEVEQALSQGTTMDTATMNRLVDIVMDRFESFGTTTKVNFGTYAELLQKLRNFDINAFRTIIQQRLSRLLSSSARPRLQEFVPYLVSAGCMTLQDLLDIVSKLLSKIMNGSSGTTQLAVEIFELMTLDNFGFDSTPETYQFAYRFFEDRQTVLRSPSQSLLLVIALLLRNLTWLESAHGNARMPSALTNFTLMLNNLALHHPKALDHLPVDRLASTLFSAPFLSTKAVIGSAEAKDNRSARLKLVFAAHDEFNNPIFCSYLRQVLPHDEDEAAKLILEALLQHNEFAVKPPSLSWKLLTSALSPKQISAVQYQAELLLMSRLLEDLQVSLEDLPEHQTTVLLSILSASNAQFSIEQATEIVKKALDMFTHAFLTTKSHGNTACSPKLERTISALLSILTFHIASVGESSFPQALLHGAIMVLSILLMNAHVTALSSSISNQLTDLLFIYSDFLQDDTRKRLSQARHNFAISDESLLDYVVGKMESRNDGWLQISSAASPGEVEEPKASQAFNIKRWEALQDATPLMGENDACLNLALFGAQKAVM